MNAPADGGSSRVFGSQHLSGDAVERYSREAFVDGVGAAGVAKLLRATVLVVGAGGLGCPVCLYLAAGGLKRLIIADFDAVDRSNLQRQIGHLGEDRIGMNKAVSLAATCRLLNPTIAVEAVEEYFTVANAAPLVSRVDVVVDASDNVATRYLVNDACVLHRKPLVSGSSMRWEGQLAVYRCDWKRRPAATIDAAQEEEEEEDDARVCPLPTTPCPCYRCWFPTPPPVGTAGSCGDDGVMGPMPGMIGCLQALEAQKVIMGAGQPLVGRMLLADGRSMAIRVVTMRPWQPACAWCGEGAPPERRALVPLGPEHGAGYCPRATASLRKLPPDARVTVESFQQALEARAARARAGRSSGELGAHRPDPTKRPREGPSDGGASLLSLVVDVRPPRQTELCGLQDSPRAAALVGAWHAAACAAERSGPDVAAPAVSTVPIVAVPIAELERHVACLLGLMAPPSPAGGEGVRPPTAAAAVPPLPPCLEELERCVDALWATSAAHDDDAGAVTCYVLCRRGRNSAIAVDLWMQLQERIAPLPPTDRAAPTVEDAALGSLRRLLRRTRLVNVEGGLSAWARRYDPAYPPF